MHEMYEIFHECMMDMYDFLFFFMTFFMGEEMTNIFEKSNRGLPV